eukprot:jgi/Picre1/30416/NNA_005780.t1
MTVQGRVESLWHVELGSNRRVQALKCFRDEYLLCGYGDCPLPTRGKTSSDGIDVDKPRDVQSTGILVVDCRDGRIVCDVSVPVQKGSSRDDIVSLEIKPIEEGVEVIFVTSKGYVWKAHLDVGDEEVSLRSTDYMGNFIDAGREDSPMEALVENALSEPTRQHDEEKDHMDEVVANHTRPRFIPQLGYRGPMDGYTYWAPPNGEQGYYRDDVMQGIMNQKTVHEDGEEESDDVRCDTLETVYKSFIRCLLPLGSASSQCIISSRGPEDGVLYLCSWKLLENGKSLFSCEKGLLGHASGVLSLAASPDGTYVVSGSYDQTIRVWDTRTWKCLKVLKGHGGGIKSLVFTRDGSLLFSTSSDNTIRVWSTSTWMCMRHLHGRHEDATWPVCMDIHEPNGNGMPRFLVSGSNGLFGGSTLKIFDIDSGNCLVTFAQLRFDHKGSCTALCIAADGSTVFTAASDSTLAGWACSFEKKEKKPLLRGGFFG